MFSVNSALIRHNIPCAIGALIGFNHFAVGFDSGATHARSLGIGVCCTAGIQMTIQWIIKRADNTVGICNGRNVANFIGSNNLCIQPHVTMLGPFCQQHVKTFLVIGQCDAAHMVQSAGHACDLF